MVSRFRPSFRVIDGVAGRGLLPRLVILINANQLILVVSIEHKLLIWCFDTRLISIQPSPFPSFPPLASCDSVGLARMGVGAVTMKIIIVVLLVLMGVGMLVLAPIVNEHASGFGYKLPQPV